MRNRAFLYLSLICCLFIATSLSAQATRTWVSGVGDDVNPCSRTAPCKTFAGAISKTAACGEISVLDPGGYGAVTITKSITIDGSGTHASVTNSGVTAFLISITNAADVCKTVILRDLSVQGGNSLGSFGVNGVRQISSQDIALHVEHMDIAHQTTRGIDINPSTTSRTFLKDVDIRHVTGEGIELRPSAGQLAKLMANDVRVRQTSAAGILTGSGLRVSNNGQGTIYDSQFQGNVNGVNIVAGGSFMVFVDTVMSNNTATGLINGGNATTLINGCTISGNNTGILNNTGGNVISFANSAIAGNNADVTGAAVTTGAHP
jgi:hypothetical protein